MSQQLVRTNLQHTGEVLVGREELLQQLRLSLKAGHRTVSLFGRHGNGKSALARRLALEMLAGSPPIPGGVWWVALEEVNDLLRIPELIAKAMKLPRTDASSQVKELDEVFAIRGRTLLVLDGVDDVSGDVLQLISHWTTSCPAVTFILTCQQELVRPDVHSCYVGALHVPNDPRKLPMSPAGELFSTIVRRRRPGFVLRARHLQRLHELLIELRGSPAAIEVLAQRMLAGDLEQELVSADEGPVALGIDRDTIATALELTWEQLDVDERAVLALSSAFHGGLTQHALMQVAGSFVSEEELTAALDSLSERLLLRLQFPEDVRTDPRYWLADSVRQRSRRTLMDSGRQSLIHHMHIQYFLNNAESLSEAFESQYGDSAVMQFRDELLNVEAALNRSLRKLPVSPTRAVIACRLLNVLWAYANLRSKYTTFLDLGLRVKELITGVDIDPGLRARLLLHLCEASLASGEADVARDCVEEAQALSVSNPDTEIATWVALQSALVCVEAGDWNDAEAFVEVATGPLREVNEEQGLVLAWRILAKIYFGTSRYEQSVSMVDKAISVIADAGATHLLATLQLQQGSALLKLERLAPALRCLEAAAQTFERFIDRPRLVETLLEIAEYHRLSGDLSAGLAICEDAQQFANRHGGLRLNQAVVQQIRQMQAVRSAVRRVSLPADVLEDSFAVTMKWIQNDEGGA